MGVTAGYIEPNVIIGQVCKMIDDEEFRQFSYGDHMLQVQQAITELACDTLYDEQQYEGEVPATGVADLPAGLVNLQNAYLFNGNKCGAGDVENLWWARNYTVFGGTGFKEQRAGNSDPIMREAVSRGTEGRLYYFNIVSGRMHFSPSCRRFGKFLLVYRGIGANLGEAPVVPQELVTAVKNYVAMACLTVLFARDPSRWGAVLNNVKRDHYGGQGVFDVGSWKQAHRRVQTLHRKWRTDLEKYLSSPNLP